MSALIQGSDEWIEFRKTMIGAADAPIIMLDSPWKTPYQLWLEKLNLIPSTFKSSAMERGLQLENEARLNFSLETGIEVSPKVVLHPSIKWMMASLDGISDDGKTAVEIKCPGQKDHSLASEGRIPDKYYAQLQHQLEVCSLDMLYYFSFDKESHYLIEVNRDDKYIKTMLKKEEEFWDCLESFVAPIGVEKYIIRNDDIWQNTASQWKAVNSQLEALQSQEKELRSTLVAMSNDYSTQGAGIKVSKSSRKGVIEYDKVPQLKDINLEAYRKDSIDIWRITSE